MTILNLEKRGNYHAGLASCETEIHQAMSFNGRIYERIYGTHWITKPDIFAIAKLNNKIIATASLLFAANYDTIPSEKYFDIPTNIADFFHQHRSKIAEIGRLTSVHITGLKLVLEVLRKEALKRGLEYFVAWTNHKVQNRLTQDCKIPLHPIQSRLNIDKAIQDPDWSVPPVRFFVRNDPPELILNVISMNGNII